MKAARLLLPLLLCACGGRDVTVTTAPKSPEDAAFAREALSWSLPPDWGEEAGQGERVATLLAGPIGRAYEVEVVRLPGDAGGPLANVNRWRAQLGLGPVGEKGLGSLVSRIPSGAGTSLMVDLSGRGADGRAERLLAAMIRSGGSTWFFKLTGPGPELAPLIGGFKSLLGSLRHDIPAA